MGDADGGVHIRPAVSLIVPFAGSREAALRMLSAIDRVRRRAGDEVVLVDNTPTGELRAVARGTDAVVVPAVAERSSYHARNVGARAAVNEWLLFVDADCVPDPQVIDAYFAPEPGHDEGLLAGSVEGDPEQRGTVARYLVRGAHLGQEANLTDSFMPYAVTANVLVRRRAWESVGGFAEGVRSGGDTQFSWRLLQAGWRLGHRPGARVLHRHRDTVRALVRATARYAAGRAWLRRRYPGAFPDRPKGSSVLRSVVSSSGWLVAGKRERSAFRALDGVVGLVDVAAERLPNRAPSLSRAVAAPADVVVCVDRYPELSETFVAAELRALSRLGVRVRIEAGRRAERQQLSALHAIPVCYAEDDAVVDKLAALAWLLARHPRRAAADLWCRRRWRREEPVPPLRALASAARRLDRHRGARLHCHFAAGAALTALRLSALCGRPYSLTAHAYDIFRAPRNLREKLERADVITTGCDYNVRHLRTLIDSSLHDKVHKVIMGVDGREFRRRQPYPGGHAIVGVGRLVEKKGFADLVRALALLPRELPARLTLIGEGPQRGVLAALIEQLGLSARVALTGALGHDSVREALERADVLAMPCVVAADGDRDSMPVVVKEALAMEVPVVATDEVGLPELVQPQWGRLVAPRDPAGLAAALGELLAAPAAEREAMGRAGRAFVLEACDVDREAARLAALLGLDRGGAQPRRRSG